MSNLRLLLRFITASLRAQAQYPASTIMRTLGQLFATVIEILAVWALFHRFGDVHGWRFGEVAVFYGLVNMMFALADMISHGFDVLGTEFLRTGEFDRLLLRPRPATLQLIGHEFRISRLGRFAQGLVVLGDRLTAHRSAVGAERNRGRDLGRRRRHRVVLRRVDAAGDDVVLDDRKSRGRERRVTYGGVQAAQYPLSLYDKMFRGFLTYVVPLACVAYFPVLVILGKPDPLGTPMWFGVVAPAAGFAFLAMAAAVAANRHPPLLFYGQLGRRTSTGS